MGRMIVAEARQRMPAVAGAFYPDQPFILRGLVRDLLERAPANAPPCAMIAPHAGYRYSGYTAACAYRCLEEASADHPQRVVLIGPSHRVYLEGASVGSFTAFSTPLGSIPLDEERLNRLAQEPDVTRDNQAHWQEHSLEVHLPFLQETVRHFRLVPMVYGRITPARLAELIQLCWQPGDLLIASSDLSHFHEDVRAKELDARCHRAVLERNVVDMAGCEACGVTGMAALLELANQRHWHSSLVDYRSSGDVTGDRSRVVGYASYLFYPQGESP